MIKTCSWISMLHWKSFTYKMQMTAVTILSYIQWEMYLHREWFLERCLVLYKYSFMTHTSFSYISIHNLPWFCLERLNLFIQVISYLLALCGLIARKEVVGIWWLQHLLMISWTLSTQPCALLGTKGTNYQKVSMPFLLVPKQESEQASQSHIPVEQRNWSLGFYVSGEESKPVE